MNCLKAEEQFSAYIEDELDYRAIRTFEAHLNACESCCQEFTLFRESLDLLHQLPQIEPSTDFDTALKTRIADPQVESTPFWGRVLQPLHGQIRLGVLMKVIEPLGIGSMVVGAIWAKILLLIIIVGFIQFKPAGLFAPKGRLSDV